MSVPCRSSDFLGQVVAVVVDRPLGSRHPEWGFVYPVNYGYVPGCLAEDGEPLDAYILGVDRPVDQLAGLCIAVVHRLDDVEDKLVVVPVPPPRGFDEAGIRVEVEFQEQYFKTVILVERIGP